MPSTKSKAAKKATKAVKAKPKTVAKPKAASKTVATSQTKVAKEPKGEKQFAFSHTAKLEDKREVKYGQETGGATIVEITGGRSIRWTLSQHEDPIGKMVRYLERNCSITAKLPDGVVPKSMGRKEKKASDKKKVAERVSIPPSGTAKKKSTPPKDKDPKDLQSHEFEEARVCAECSGPLGEEYHSRKSSKGPGAEPICCTCAGPKCQHGAVQDVSLE